MDAPKYLKNHSNYSQPDYEYLRVKGYTNREIEMFWNRDASDGKGPVLVNKYTIDFPNITGCFTR